MRWLKHTTVVLLLLGAAGVALATAFSDHSEDYGAVGVPQGGTVRLPEGTVKVYYEEQGQEATTSQLSSPLGFQVVPAGGGSALQPKATAEGTDELQVQRSESLGSLGSVADVEVPASGDYVVAVSTGAPAGTASLTFGTTAANAVADKWKLLAGLVGAALLISLVPVPRRSSAWDDASHTGWSSDPTSPYAGRSES